MRIILLMLRKEFRQIFRNKSMLPVIFFMPIIQLLILANAATYEIKHIRINIIDLDNSSVSRGLVSRFRGSAHFEIVNYSQAHKAADDDMLYGKTDAILEIPPDFEKLLIKESGAKVQLIINAIDGAAAGVISSYSLNILKDYNRDIRVKYINPVPLQNPATIGVTSAYWFNPELDYKTFMVPGLMVMLVTMVSLFLGGMNIVREKEIGTIEQLNVTPIKKWQFIIGKLTPFWLLGMFELALGLTVGKFAFQIEYLGNVGVLFLFASVYLLVVLGIGFLISTFTETQQQAMFISWFFMVIFILMSGLFTAIENMPVWAQRITLFNPIAYFIKVMRMVLLKGSGFAEISRLFYSLIVFAVVMNSLAVWNYRKRS